MIRAMKPIEFNSAYIFNMNLDSFVTVSIKYNIKIKFRSVLCSTDFFILIQSFNDSHLIHSLILAFVQSLILSFALFLSH